MHPKRSKRSERTTYHPGLPPGDEETLRRAIEHAQWRVGAFHSILEDHLSKPTSRQNDEWAPILQRVRRAEAQLARLEGATFVRPT